MKNVNQALLSYLSIREDYFGETPTKLSMKELSLKLMMEYETIPFIEFAVVLQLVTLDHQQMVEATKKITGRSPEFSTEQYFAQPRKLFSPKHH